MAENMYSFSAHFKSDENIAHELRDTMQIGFTYGQTRDLAKERVTRGLASNGYTDIRVTVAEAQRYEVGNFININDIL